MSYPMGFYSHFVIWCVAFILRKIRNSEGLFDNNGMTGFPSESDRRVKSIWSQNNKPKSTTLLRARIKKERAFLHSVGQCNRSGDWIDPLLAEVSVDYRTSNIHHLFEGLFMSLRTSKSGSAGRSLSPVRQRVTEGEVLSPRGLRRSPASFGSPGRMVNVDMESNKPLLDSPSSRRRKTTFQGTSYWVIFLAATTLYLSIMISNYVVFDVLGGKRDIQFVSLLWGIMNTAISCMNLSAVRSFAIPILAKCTSNSSEATRMLFDETLVQPMSRLWIGLVVGVCFTYAATGFNLPPWTQLRFSATSYTVSVAWAFSLLSTFQQLSSGE